MAAVTQPTILASCQHTRQSSGPVRFLRLPQRVRLAAHATEQYACSRHPRLQRSWRSSSDSSSTTQCQAQLDADALDSAEEVAAVGEDAAYFDVEEQTVKSWSIFTVLLVGVLGLLYAVWIAPGTGAEKYLQALESVSSNPEVMIVAIMLVFGVAHSGLAFLRPYGEELIGPRAYRVIFALVSLPLAVVAVVYFIDHRYSGTSLWNLRGVPGVHELVWLLSFVSFFFLYPSTFNLLEVAAVDEPRLHLWETGVIRITRHPQAFGQGLWCLAHTLWIGNSFMLVTSAALMAHHIFGCWHGDFRLKRQHGKAFEEVKARTSAWPFAALLDGRQQLPADYWREWLRLPYFTITAFTLGTYFAHPPHSASLLLAWLVTSGLRLMFGQPIAEMS